MDESEQLPAPILRAIEKATADAQDPELDPVGLEFWLGQLFSIAIVIAGILVAAKAGFFDAAEFERIDELHGASSRIQLVRDEVVSNLEAVRKAHDDLVAGKQPRMPLEMAALLAEAASSGPELPKSLVGDLIRLFEHPLPHYSQVFRERQVDRRDREHLVPLLEGVLARGQKLLDRLDSIDRQFKEELTRRAEGS